MYTRGDSGFGWQKRAGTAAIASSNRNHFRVTIVFQEEATPIIVAANLYTSWTTIAVLPWRILSALIRTIRQRSTTIRLGAMYPRNDPGPSQHEIVAKAIAAGRRRGTS